MDTVRNPAVCDCSISFYIEMAFYKFIKMYLRNEANFDVLYTIYCNLGQFTLIIRECLSLFEENLERKSGFCMTRSNIFDAKKTRMHCDVMVSYCIQHKELR